MKPDFLDELPPEMIVPRSEPVVEPNYPYHILLESWTNKDSEIINLSEVIYNSLADCCYDHSSCEDNVVDLDPTLFVVDFSFDRVKNNNRIKKSIDTLFKVVLKVTKATQMNVSLLCKKDNGITILNQIQVSRDRLQIDYKNNIIITSFSDSIRQLPECYNDFAPVCEEIVEKRKKYETHHKVSHENYFNIININSPIEIPQEAIAFMEIVVKSGRSQFLSLFDKLVPHYSNDPLPIPILLKDSSDMPSYEELWRDIKGDDKDKYIPKSKVLGYYSRPNTDCEVPHIVLCPQNIEECSIDIIPSHFLYTKVLIHEIAHAVLDKFYEYNLYHDIYDGWAINEGTNDWPWHLYAKAMEESLANMITLQWVKAFKEDSELFEYAKNYILAKQPEIYKFGWWQYEADVDWHKWRESSKHYTQNLQVWFENCFDNGKIRVPLDYNQGIYNSAFEE